MRRTDSQIVAGQLFFLLQLVIGCPGRWQVKEGVAEHRCQPGHKIVPPGYVLQFMGQHRLKLTSIEVFDHPRREKHRRPEQAAGERQRSIIDIQQHTRSSGAEPLCQVISERL